MNIDYADFAESVGGRIDGDLWRDGGYTTSTLQGQFGTVRPQVRKATVAILPVLDLRSFTRTLPTGAVFAEAVDCICTVGSALGNVQSQLDHEAEPVRDLTAQMSSEQAPEVWPTVRSLVRLGVRQPVMRPVSQVEGQVYDCLLSTGNLFSA